MSPSSLICVTFLIALLTLTATSASGRGIKPISKRRNFIQKLNLFISYVDQGFKSVASSMKALKNLQTEEREIDSRLIANINSSIQLLNSLQPGCLEGWAKYGASCFLFFPATRRFSAQKGKETCEEKNAHLAKCTSPEQQKFFVSSVKPDAGWIIIGGNDRDEDGTWRWPDGSPMDSGYTNWQQGQPKSKKRTNCMYFTGSQKTWRTMPCKSIHSSSNEAVYICEMPLIF